MSNNVSGILLHYFGIAVLLALPVSLVLLTAYRRSVRRRMRERSRAASAAPGRASGHAPAAASPGTPGSGPGEAYLRRRIAAVYTTAALAAGAVSAVLHIVFFGHEWNLLRVCVMAYALAWPAVPTLALLLNLTWRAALLLALGYYVAGAAAVVQWSLFSSHVLGRADVSAAGNLASFTGFLVVDALAPLAVILATGVRKLRPVTPLVLAGLLAFSYGALALQQAFFSLVGIAPVRSVLLSVPRADVVWFMLCALPVAYLCWLALRGLARRYEAKAFSDAQLVADSWWLIAAFSTSVTLASERGLPGLLGLLAFVAYRGVVGVGLRLWRVDPTAAGSGRLLLLRVFGYRRRTEKLFDAVGERWRLVGNVQMIGGADLAGRTIDPGDIVGFAGGRLRDQFVSDAADLERRLDELDAARDPDGRFRVNEFLCHDDTWRETLEALLLRSEAVLMDLRGFAAANSGCLFELQKLVEHRLLERTLFVVDDSTDLALLRATLAARTGDGEPAPVVHAIDMRRPSVRELRRIHATLSALATA